MNRTVEKIAGLLLILVILMPGCTGSGDPYRRHMDRARKYFEAGRYQEARIELLGALKEKPGSQEGYLALGSTLVKLRSYDGAYQAYAAAYELGPEKRETVLALARFLTGGGSYDRSAVVLEKWLGKNPSDTAALGLLAGDRMHLGQLDAALESARKVTKLAPDLAAAWAGLAGVHMARNEPEAAMKAVEKARSLKDPPFSAEMIYSDLLISGGRLKEAEDHLREAAGRFPDRPELPLRQAYLAGKLGREAEAEAIYQDIIRRFPDDLMAYVRLVGLYAREKRLAELKGWLEAQMTSSDTSDTGAAQLALLGMVQEAAGDREAAGRTYRQALEIKPDFVPVLNNLAWNLGEEGELEEALALAKKARDLAPENPLLADTLGWILHRGGDSEAALPLLRQAAAGAPGHPVIKEHLAQVLAAVGREEEAQGVRSDGDGR